METVLVERTLSGPADKDRIDEMLRTQAGCLDAWNVRLLGSLVSADRRRMICVFEAPDVEAVRRLNEVAGLPYDRAWAASLHPAPTLPPDAGLPLPDALAPRA